MGPSLRHYVTKQYLQAMALVIAVVLVIFVVIDFGDRLKLFVGKPPTLVLELYLMKVASILGQLLPAAALLGAGITLTNLKRQGELDAMRSAGISPVSVFLPMLLCAGVVTLLHIVFEEKVGAPASARVDRLMRDKFKVWGDTQFFYNDHQWLRSEGRIMRVSSSEGDDVFGLSLFLLGPDFSLKERVDAARAHPAGNGYTMYGAAVRDYEKEPHLYAKEVDEVHLSGVPKDIFALKPGRPEHMSSSDLVRQQQLRAKAGLSTVRYALAQHQRYTYPWLGVIGAALAAVLSLRAGRRPALTIAVVEGLVVSSLIWGSWVMSRALALSGRMSVMAATYGVVLGLFAVALVLIWKTEVSR